MAKKKNDEVEQAKQTLLGMIPQLKSEGYVKLEIDYEGANDEGAIQKAFAYKKGDSEAQPFSLSDTEQDAAASVVYNLYPGWETDKGTHGRVVVNVLKKTVTVKHVDYAPRYVRTVI